MNKLALSINILDLKGARRMNGPGGRDCIVIDIAASRLKPHDNGKVYINLDAVENKEVKYNQTHFICEATTKEQREAGDKGNIVGNAKTFGPQKKNEAPVTTSNEDAAWASQSPPNRTAADALDDAQRAQAGGLESDDIPFN